MSLTDLLTVGEAFDDLIFLDLPRIPRPGEEIKTSRFVTTVGGGAVITAIAARRLGLACRVITGVGEGGLARLYAEGVSVANLLRPGEPHAISAALSTLDNRSFVTFNGMNDDLEARLAPALERETARHVHFAFFPRSCRRWLRIAGRLRAAGVTTSWDFGWNEALLDDRYFPPLLQSLDYVMLNEQEAMLYARRRAIGTALAYWRRCPMHVIVKLGAQGSRWVGHGVDLTASARRARVVDTTGAGDAFNGGFLTARLQRLDAAASLSLGNHVGTMSTRRAGGVDGLPAVDELPARFRPSPTQAVR